MRMDIVGFEVNYYSDLKKYGITEDGEDFIGEVFLIEVASKTGERWVYQGHFDGVKVESSEWGIGFLDTRPQAKAACQKIIDSVQRMGFIDLNDWQEARPSYGSEAYINGNWSRIDAQQERMDEGWSLRADMME